MHVNLSVLLLLCSSYPCQQPNSLGCGRGGSGFRDHQSAGRRLLIQHSSSSDQHGNCQLEIAFIRVPNAYMISDSGRALACTNFGIFFRCSRFSPFAEEGFTCLDHSAMSKKNIYVYQMRFFLICRRARRQRSQSPVLGTSRIDKHFELYNEQKTKRKTKEFPISLSSDEAKEQIPFDSPIGRKERGKLYNSATQFGHHARL